MIREKINKIVNKYYNKTEQAVERIAKNGDW
jgi:hypothetical protein